MNVDYAKTISKFQNSLAVTMTSVQALDGLAHDMAALYQSCLSKLVVCEDMKFHVAAMPESKCDRSIFSMHVPEEQDTALCAETILSTFIGPHDCVICLGADILNKQHSEADIMAMVIADISFHIDRIWAIQDRNLGWPYKHIGVAAARAILAAASGPLAVFRPNTDTVNAIKAQTADCITREMQLTSPELEFIDAVSVYRVIDTIAAMACKTLGGYISLPAKPLDIRNAARAMIVEVMNAPITPDGKDLPKKRHFEI